MANSKSNSRAGSLKSFSEAAGATKNLRRFGASIKRVVREVKEESSVSESRDTLVDRYNKVVYTSRILEEAYHITLSTLVSLHNQYLKSKQVKNVLDRYSILRKMIKDTLRLERNWWSGVEMPTQNRAESIPDFVLRVCKAMEYVVIPADAANDVFRETNKERDLRLEKVNEMTSKQLMEENTLLYNSAYRLLKKYLAIRSIVKTLRIDYNNSKYYPIMPRYKFLKEMIKEVTHHPDYMEHQHESRVQPD